MVSEQDKTAHNPEGTKTDIFSTKNDATPGFPIDHIEHVNSPSLVSNEGTFSADRHPSRSKSPYMSRAKSQELNNRGQSTYTKKIKTIDSEYRYNAKVDSVVNNK